MHRLFPSVLLAVALACAAPPDGGARRSERAALDTDGGAKQLVFLAGDLSDDELLELRAAAPNVRILAGLSRSDALAHAARAHGAEARFVSEEFLRAAPQLRWVQAMSAGVERCTVLDALVARDDVVLTNMRAVHGPAIADHVFAMLLSLSRDLRRHWRAQQAATWERAEPDAEPFALAGRTMLVVGLGGIGVEVARRAHGFGMRVLATRRSDAPAPDFVERVERAGALLELLPQADVVAVCVPLTAETERLFDARAFAAMKPGAILVNVARGGVCDTEALVAALRRGHLGGACLDVTDPEPLPPGHALWGMANVVITPHVAARAGLTEERRRALFRENLRRFGAGEPLLNVVDKRAGY